MEETGAFVAATFIMKSERQLLEQLHHDGRRTCQFWPKHCPYGPHFPLDAVRMAPILPLLELLQRLRRMVFRTTTNLLDQEDCCSISLLKKFRVCNLRGY